MPRLRGITERQQWHQVLRTNQPFDSRLVDHSLVIKQWLARPLRNTTSRAMADDDLDQLLGATRRPQSDPQLPVTLFMGDKPKLVWPASDLLAAWRRVQGAGAEHLADIHLKLTRLTQWLTHVTTELEAKNRDFDCIKKLPLEDIQTLVADLHAQLRPYGILEPALILPVRQTMVIRSELDLEIELYGWNTRDVC